MTAPFLQQCLFGRLNFQVFLCGFTSPLGPGFAGSYLEVLRRKNSPLSLRFWSEKSSPLWFVLRTRGWVDTPHRRGQTYNQGWQQEKEEKRSNTHSTPPCSNVHFAIRGFGTSLRPDQAGSRNSIWVRSTLNPESWLSFSNSICNLERKASGAWVVVVR